MYLYFTKKPKTGSSASLYFTFVHVSLRSFFTQEISDGHQQITKQHLEQSEIYSFAHQRHSVLTLFIIYLIKYSRGERVNIWV